MSAGRFENEARRELEKSESYQRWIRARIDTIHSRVSAADVLRSNGVRLRYGGSKPEQVFCPFHGNTRTMAARYHPEEGQSKAGIWCFVCNERWDVIGLWKKFHGYEGSFGGLLRSIEREYGIEPPEAPPASFEEEAAEDYELAQLFEACERRLRSAKRAFTLESFLTVSSLLEKLYFRVEKGGITLGQAKDILRKALDKIGQKERECPDG